MKEKVPRRYLTVLLTMVLTLPIISTDIYLPSLYAMGGFFDTSHQKVQLTLTLYFLTFGVVQLGYGSLSDRLGRRPMMLLSLTLYVLGTLVCIFAKSIHSLILGRCVQALGAGSAILVFAIIRDLYNGDKVAKMITYMGGVVAISPIIAPIFGGYIESSYSWHWNFVFLLVFSGLLLVMCCFSLPETNPYKDKTTVQNMILLFNKEYMKNALGASFAFAALFSFISGSHFIFLNLMKYSPEQFGWVFAIAAIGYVLGAFLSGRLIPVFGLDLVLAMGKICLTGGALIMVLFCYFCDLNPLAVIIPQLVCEVGIAIIVPIGVTKALQPIPEYAGAGSALIGFIRFLFAAISSFLTMQFQGPFSLAIIILCFSVCTSIVLRRNKLVVIQPACP